MRFLLAVLLLVIPPTPPDQSRLIQKFPFKAGAYEAATNYERKFIEEGAEKDWLQTPGLFAAFTRQVLTNSEMWANSWLVSERFDYRKFPKLGLIGADFEPSPKGLIGNCGILWSYTSSQNYVYVLLAPSYHRLSLYEVRDGKCRRLKSRRIAINNQPASVTVVCKDASVQVYLNDALQFECEFANKAASGNYGFFLSAPPGAILKNFYVGSPPEKWRLGKM